MHEHPIVVYGATGYTGRLICTELERSGTRFAIAGRDRDKLERLRQQLGLDEQAVITADAGDATSLQRMAEQARVVLSCAGPFTRWGPPLQDAALVAGTHFIDITAEYPYMLATHRRHEEAVRRGVVLVNAAGFDAVPGEATAVLASEALGEPPEAVRTARAVENAGFSRGTMHSMVVPGCPSHLSQSLMQGASYRAGQWVEEPLGQSTWKASFPPPLGPRMGMSVPWGDIVAVPRSTGARTVQAFVADPPLSLRLSFRLARVLRWALSVGWLRSLLERGVSRLPEGPSAAQRARTRCTFFAEARSAAGRARTAWLTARDPYELTAAAAALCARLAAAEGFTQCGALTPCQAFGARALLDGLADHGVQWGVD